VVLPENDPLSDSLKPSSASVFVKYDPSSQARQNVTQIKQLVLNGIEGLTIDKISVITVQGKDVTIPPPVYDSFSGVVMLKSSVPYFWGILAAAGVPLAARSVAFLSCLTSWSLGGSGSGFTMARIGSSISRSGLGSATGPPPRVSQHGSPHAL